MAQRRHPSGAFFRRLKAHSEPKQPDVVKPVTWIRELKESDRWLWGEFIGFISVVAALFAFYLDLKDRQTQRVVQAWQLVTHNSPGNSGKGPALEYLHRQGIPMVGLDLSTERDQSPVYLPGLNLPGANLYQAKLSGANLVGANLSGANLVSADLSGADLRDANLSGAKLRIANLSGAYLMDANLSGAELVETDLTEADLRDANLSGAFLVLADLQGADLSPARIAVNTLEYASAGADLSGADLWRADLSEAILVGVDLRKVRNLDQETLDGTCGDEETQLPKGLAIKACPKEELEIIDFSGFDFRGTIDLDQKMLDRGCGDENTLLPNGFIIKACPPKLK